MGLDMYLTAEKYISGYSEQTKRDIALEGLEGDHPPTTEGTSVTISLDVAYWRKANQIHNWFVERVQGGEDDCRTYHVPLEDLRELVTTCEGLLVKRDPELAEEELPTASGFFFGNTEYEDDYWADLEDTVAQLRPVLEWFDADEKRRFNWDLQYRASW